MAIIKCPECNGTGEKGTCGSCGGKGQVLDLNAGDITCPRCNGSGIEPGRCPWCSGTGEVDDGNKD